MEQKDVNTLSAEIDAVHVDLRTDPDRAREFELIVNALAASKRFEVLMTDLAEEFRDARTPRQVMASVLSIAATGIQAGLDIEKARRKNVN